MGAPAQAVSNKAQSATVTEPRFEILFLHSEHVMDCLMRYDPGGITGSAEAIKGTIGVVFIGPCRGGMP